MLFIQNPLKLLPDFMVFSPIAQELNKSLKESSPQLYESLSEMGKKIFFPKGILSQGSEAKEHAHLYDATLGVAKDEGNPMVFPEIRKYFQNLGDSEIFPYSPVEGKKKLRQIWHKQIFEKNPSLAGKKISLPIVTNGITHAISIAADLFCDPKDTVLIPDLLWGNYRLMFSTVNCAKIQTFPLFTKNLSGFNCEGLRQTLERATENRQKIMLLLNFPNNPTGYTPTRKEMEEIRNILIQFASYGKRIILLSDDAYFGLNFADGCPESLFALSADTHENLINVKLDGATKEDYVWGFRTGFITFSLTCADRQKAYEIIENKIKGLIRARISNLNHASQSILEKCLEKSEILDEAKVNYNLMHERVIKTKEILENKKFEKFFTPYPFNSGYFMCIRFYKINAEEFRVHLLKNYGVGTISINADSLRIGYCAIDKRNLVDFFEQIYSACQDLNS